MKKTITVKTASIILAGAILFSSCASTTMIHSIPSGARVYLDEESVGYTPYSHTDTKIVGTTTTVRLEKEGYETFYTVFSRNEEVDVGAVIGGLFVLVPFLWTMKYKPSHTYELIPVYYYDQPTIPSAKDQNISSKADRLRELKQLLDEGIITQEEYQQEKTKILDE